MLWKMAGAAGSSRAVPAQVQQDVPSKGRKLDVA